MASRIVEKVLPRRLGVGFRWLIASSWVSNLGDGFALAAGPLLIASQTRNPTLVALATLLQRLPWLAFAVFAGALADRWNRVAMAATVDLARAGVLAVLAVTILTHRVDIALVLIVMFVLGTAEVFSNTAANTVLPAIVDRRDLTVANARLYAGFATVYQLAGPPIGAALFAAGMSLPFAGQAVLVAAGAVLVTRVKLPPREEPVLPTRRVRAEIAEGFRWAMRHAAVRTLVLTIFTFNITFGAAWSVLVLWARERLGMGPVGFGLLTTAGAVGGILGTVSYGRITRRVSLGNLMRIGLVIETFTHLAFALTTVPVVALCIMAVFGAHAFIWGTTSITVRQRAVPEGLQGRISSVNSLGVFGGLVAGAALGGPIAAHFGITAPFWFAFVGSAVFVVLIWRQLKYIAHDDEERPHPATEATLTGEDPVPSLGSPAVADFPPILTDHLRLQPLMPATLDALLAGDREAASRAQGVEITPAFVESVDDFFLRIQLERMTENPGGRGWCVRTVERRGDGELLGHCGFHGPPEDVGRAEIGYTILPSYRGRGYATEAAAALVRYAFQHGADTVFASVSPANAPSLRVVEKLGFVQTGVQTDEIDGEELVFELRGALDGTGRPTIE